MVFVPFLDFVQKIVSVSRPRTNLHFTASGAQFGFDDNIWCSRRNGRSDVCRTQVRNKTPSDKKCVCSESSLTNTPLP